MPRTPKQRPTNFELEILKTLWDQGPSTVRQVVDALRPRRSIGYTTALKMLQIMTEKGLVTRDEQRRAHIYRARERRRTVARRLAGDLLERAFDGSARQLLLHALEYKKATPEELAEIRRLLDELERSRK